jgi:hypothetical protein
VLFLEAEEIFARLFFMAFLNSPCHETAMEKNAIKKNRTKQPREKKTTEEKKPAFFVMSRDGLFRNLFFVFLNSPCYETPEKCP